MHSRTLFPLRYSIENASTPRVAVARKVNVARPRPNALAVRVIAGNVVVGMLVVVVTVMVVGVVLGGVSPHDVRFTEPRRQAFSIPRLQGLYRRPWHSARILARQFWLQSFRLLIAADSQGGATIVRASMNMTTNRTVPNCYDITNATCKGYPARRMDTCLIFQQPAATRSLSPAGQSGAEIETSIPACGTATDDPLRTP